MLISKHSLNFFFQFRHILYAVGSKEDYKGADGLIYCGKCRTPKQGRIESGKMAGRLSPRRCTFYQKLLDRQQAIQKENRHMFAVDKLIKDRFSDASMHLWIFENNNGNCPHTDKARFYAKNFYYAGGKH